MFKHMFRTAIAASLLALAVVGLAAERGYDPAPVPESRMLGNYIGRAEDRHDLPRIDGRNEWAWFRKSGIPARRVGLATEAGTSPGIPICTDGTMYDMQHNDDGQRQIATLGSDGLTHFAWMHWDTVCDCCLVTRFVNYNSYSPATGLTIGECGWTISGASHDPIEAAGTCANLDVGTGDLGHIAFHQRNAGSQVSNPKGPFGSWVLNQGFYGIDLFRENELAGSAGAEAIWPHLAIDRGGGAKAPGDDVFHVTAHPSGEQGGFTNEIFYWRRVGKYPNAWEGPVVLDINAGTLNHHVATDPSSQKIAVIYEVDDNPQDLLEVAYLQSNLNGSDWADLGAPAFPTPLTSLGVSRTEVTSYSDPDGKQAWVECTGEYDQDGRLHVVWVEQRVANVSSECRLMHWDDVSATAHVIRQAYDFLNIATDGLRDLWLSSPQIAFGDGSTLCTDGPANPGSGGGTSNANYVYVSYSQAGGPTPEEGNDATPPQFGDPQNLEIYLSVSNDHGLTWAPPANLTNTKTPICDGTPGNECASERDPSIALTVNDTIHIFYVLDLFPGDAELGQGWFTFNPVMYYRIPGGTDAEYVCPAIAPRFQASLSNQHPDCEYHATYDPPGSQVEQLTIQNLGNAPLAGEVSVSPPEATWLQLTTGAYSLLPGEEDMRTVTMDASDASIAGMGEGLYQAQIEITHNDTTQPSPRIIPVDFFVFDAFYCSEELLAKTSCLWLEVSSGGGFGGEYATEGNLTRLSGDSSWSVFDGSLIIGVPPNPDTLVYRDLFGEGNGQPGYRPLKDMVIDTSAYGTGAGEATMFAQMTTVDSTLGIDVTYRFPQHPDSCDFVIAEYAIYNRTGNALNDVVAGQAVDFDVMPRPDSLANLQVDAQNTGHLEPVYNLIYQQGSDSIGHVIVGDVTATRFKAGITAIQCTQAPRAWIAPNDPWLFQRPGGGFTEGYLYEHMTETGFELFPPNDPDPEEDLHGVLVMAQDIDLAPGDTTRYCVGLVSSNTAADETGIIAVTAKAWKYSFGWQQVVVNDTVPEFTAVSYPYRARGTHEGGLASGCCGCIVTEIADEHNVFSITGGDCAGTIEFAGGDPCLSPYTASFSVTDLCEEYEDIVQLSIAIAGDCQCECPHQGDCDYVPNDPYITALDLGCQIDHLFVLGEDCITDPKCPVNRCDWDCDQFTTALDLGLCIDYLFASGPGPCDPCEK